MTAVILALIEDPAFPLLAQGAVSGVLLLVYRDCRKDRAELWAEIRALKGLRR